MGGNAIDAAVAAALTLGVVDNHNSGLGGGCFILVRRADGQIVAIDGRERAPAAATRDMFLRDGKAVPELSRTGPLAVGVPGALSAYALVLEACGGRCLGDLILPAAQIAEQGFTVDEVYARRLASVASTLARFPGSKAALLKQDGTPYAAGEVLRQHDLAQTYRGIATHGVDWFYTGKFATQVADWMAEHGGILTAQDFAQYEAKRREPIVSRYRQWKVIGFPPPSSGGVHVAQMLNMLEEFDLPQAASQSPDQLVHLMVETMKRAFADRAHWLGDADYADVPRGLVDRQYAKALVSTIDPTRATAVPGHGTPPRAAEDLFERHTTHIAAADSDGNWVAITATVNTTFGSKVIVPGTGVVLNNEMDDFSAQPGVPNAFGLLGAESNAVQAGKRPLSSMSPTIVLDDDQPVLTVGAAGGPKIITQVLQTIVRHLDLGEPLAEAVASPRYHHQWRPDEILAESTAPPKVLEALQARGHKIEVTDQSGVTQAIARSSDGTLFGVHDPRVPGSVETGER
jgi:gamma-glutamyltranspeptidase/glutathione hydrolase